MSAFGAESVLCVYERNRPISAKREATPRPCKLSGKIEFSHHIFAVAFIYVVL